MSCTTLYAVRQPDGWTFSTQKYGLVDLSSPDAVHGLLGQTTRVMTTGGWLCRGLLVDATQKLARFHSCHHELNHPTSRAWERSVQDAVAWAGWDVRFAWGGNDELAERLGESAPPLAVASEVHCATIHPRHCRYSAATHQLDYDEEPVLTATFSERPAMVTVVSADGRGRHHAVLATWESAQELLGMGPGLADVVSGSPVWPTIEEDQSGGWGMLIDQQRRELGFWGIRCTPGQVAALAKQHPDWTVTRLVEGYAAQLARAGADPAPWCVGAGRPWTLQRPYTRSRRPVPARRPGVTACREVAHSIGWDWQT